ncbi:MAG: hypothetical protein ACRBFS_21665 [Aureispira sp.]
MPSSTINCMVVSRRKPFCLLAVGLQGAGKTYNLERLVNRSGRRMVLVYNTSNPDDWKGYIEIELLYDVKKKRLAFIYEGRQFDFQKYYLKKFKGKKVKADEMEGLSETEIKRGEKQLFRHIKKMSGLFFILDDASTVFDNGKLTRDQNAIFKGKNYNVWFAFVFHGANLVPPRMWNAVTHIRMFYNNTQPPPNKRNIITNYSILLKMYQVLRKLPKRSFITLDVLLEKVTITPYYPR